MIAPKNEIPSAAMRERTIGELRRYISKSELAALTGLSPATIHRYKDAGQLASCFLSTPLKWRSVSPKVEARPTRIALTRSSARQ
jgi:predicted DNA-binding transcriptional regulator AlpA